MPNHARLPILPIAVLRRAGARARPFASHHFEETSLALRRIESCRSFTLSHRDAACDLLARVIGVGLAKNVTAELLRLRRDLFNSRAPKPLSAPAQNVLQAHAEEHECGLIERFIASAREEESAIQAGEAALARETLGAQAQLRKSIRHPEFRRALALASPSLYSEMEAYVRRNGGAENRRERQTEAALLRYYTRSVFKTSPFSSFARSVVLHLEPTPLCSLGTPRRFRLAKLNRTLVASIAESLAKYAAIRPRVRICPSRSLSRAGAQLLVLRREYGRLSPTRMRIPKEAVVVLRSGELLRRVESCFVSSDETVTFEELTRRLRSVLPDDTDTAELVEKLVGIGLLILRPISAGRESSGISELRSFLEDIPGEIVSDTKRAVEVLENLETEYPAAEPRARLLLVQTGCRTVAEIFSRTQPSASVTWDGPIIFEDCTETTPVSGIDAESWMPVLGDLSSFVSSHLPLLDYNLSMRRAIALVLCKHFGHRAATFLECLRTWQNRDHRRTPETREGFRHTPNPLGDENTTQLAALRNAMGRVLAAPMDADEIDINDLAREHGWLHRMDALNLQLFYTKSPGASVYCHPFVTALGESSIVVNSIDAGVCKAALRTLAALPPGPARSELLQRVRRALHAAFPGTTVADLTGSYDFNANLRPAIADVCIDCSDESAGEPGVRGLEDIALRVREDGKLVVIDLRDNRELTPLNFGMLGMNYVPVSHYLLAAVSNIDLFSKKPLHPFFWSPLPDTGCVLSYPRLVTGRCVLRRRGWSVPPSCLPRRDAGESEFRFLLRVDSWRRALGIPDQVFISNGLYAASGAPGANTRKQWINRKPQYVHFGNILTRLFERMVAETSSPLYIEEALPTLDQLPEPCRGRLIEIVLDFAPANAAGAPDAVQLDDRQNQAFASEIAVV